MRALLQYAADGTIPSPPTASPLIIATSVDEAPENLTADIVVIITALLCAILCLVGLAWLNRCHHDEETSGDAVDTESSGVQHHHQQQHAGVVRHPFPPPPKRGLKKSALRALPKMPYDKTGDVEKQKDECAICLMEFEDGEEIRRLPQCGHEFHVACIDRWLQSRSSCPSCRRILVVAPPPKRGFDRDAASNKAAFGEGAASTFLP